MYRRLSILWTVVASAAAIGMWIHTLGDPDCNTLGRSLLHLGTFAIGAIVWRFQPTSPKLSSKLAALAWSVVALALIVAILRVDLEDAHLWCDLLTRGNIIMMILGFGLLVWSPGSPSQGGI